MEIVPSYQESRLCYVTSPFTNLRW